MINVLVFIVYFYIMGKKPRCCSRRFKIPKVCKFESCRFFKPHPSKKITLCVKVEIINNFSFFFCLLPVYWKINKLFSIYTFYLSSFLLVYRKVTKSKWKLYLFTCLKNILFITLYVYRNNVSPLIKRLFY